MMSLKRHGGLDNLKGLAIYPNRSIHVIHQDLTP